MKRWIWSAALLMVLTMGAAVFAADVAVLKSDATRDWYYSLGWDWDSEHANVLALLSGMELDVAELSDDQLAAAELGDAKVLVLVNNRMMSGAQVDAVKAFVANGGKVFGLYQSSFRNEANQNVNPVNNYQLDELYNISYMAWTGSAPAHAFIKGDSSHPIWEGLPEFVPTSRYTAMVNAVLEGGQVIGEWYNADQTTKSQADLLNGAIIVSEDAVYVGENLFDPMVYSDASVQQLIKNIVSYLLP